MLSAACLASASALERLARDRARSRSVNVNVAHPLARAAARLNTGTSASVSALTQVRAFCHDRGGGTDAALREPMFAQRRRATAPSMHDPENGRAVIPEMPTKRAAREGTIPSTPDSKSKALESQFRTPESPTPRTPDRLINRPKATPARRLPITPGPTPSPPKERATTGEGEGRETERPINRPRATSTQRLPLTPGPTPPKEKARDEGARESEWPSLDAIRDHYTKEIAAIPAVTLPPKSPSADTNESEKIHDAAQNVANSSKPLVVPKVKGKAPEREGPGTPPLTTPRLTPISPPTPTSMSLSTHSPKPHDSLNTSILHTRNSPTPLAKPSQPTLDPEVVLDILRQGQNVWLSTQNTSRTRMVPYMLSLCCDDNAQAGKGEPEWCVRVERIEGLGDLDLPATIDLKGVHPRVVYRHAKVPGERLSVNAVWLMPTRVGGLGVGRVGGIEGGDMFSGDVFLTAGKEALNLWQVGLMYIYAGGGEQVGKDA